MKRAFLAFFLIGLAGCTHGPVATKTTTARLGPLTRVIDAHVHFDEEGLTPEALAEFRDNHVVGAVAHASRKQRQVVGREVSSVPFALCAAVVPGETVAAVEKGLREDRYQCMKVYLGYVPKWASDPFYKPFYRLAERYDVPLVFHTGDPIEKSAKVKYADPLTIDEIAVEYPKVKFVLAHMGNPWFASAAEVAYKNDNVYVDTSAILLGDVSKASPEAVEELVVKPIRWFYLYVENPKKILFGTDWPVTRIGPYIEAVKRAIPSEHWDDVFYGNAARLFRIGEPIKDESGQVKPHASRK